MNFSINNSDSDCYRLYFIGSYLFVTCLAGIFLNTILLWMFHRHQELRTPINRLIIAITVNNLIGCIIDLPLQIISSFKCG
jgi:hypothetical protein